MDARAVYHRIRKEKLGGSSLDLVHQLFQMDQSDFDEVVEHLLNDDGKYLQQLGDYEYVDRYYCQLAGSVLFAFRPNADLYHHVLDNSIKIGDPSSCRDAVVALLQIKSPTDVAIDLLEMMDTHPFGLTTDEVNSRILGMFYWLGTSLGGLKMNRAWPGYMFGEYYTMLLDMGLDERDPETIQPSTPPTDPLQAKEVSSLILEKMLNLFEDNNANRTARSVISLLPMPDMEYVVQYRDRIIRAFVSANVSQDEYVRHRVSGKAHQHFISQN